MTHSRHDGPLPPVYLFQRTSTLPLLLSVLAVGLAVTVTGWALLAVPFIWLGAACSTPFLNLIDALPAILAIIVGQFVARFHIEAGTAVSAGTFFSFALACLQARRCMVLRPPPDAPEHTSVDTQPH